MLQKTLGVTLILVLGGIWFVLQEFSTPDQAQASGAERIVTAQGAGQPGNPLLRRDAAGSAPAGARARGPGPTAKPPPQALRADAPPATATGNGAGSEAFQQAMASAAKLHAAGDPGGAEAALRQALAQAGNSEETGRAALQLAALTGNRLERRQLLSVGLMEGAVQGVEFETVGQMLRDLNTSPNSSLIPLLTVERYTVEPNDSLWKLVNKTFPDRYGVSPEVGLLKLVNGMSKDTLRVGQVLLVPIAELSLRVDAHQHGLVAWLGDVAIAAYRVGLGKDERTPMGAFVIKVKQEDPTWFFDGRVIPHGDPENVLGTRWLGFDDQPGAMGFGIHGTTSPETIGFSESMGCVRMRNHEVEELFEFVARGTRVVIG
jgi:lipoprotein-anchoring transpeptidase ErfK/SrfK